MHHLFSVFFLLTTTSLTCLASAAEPMEEIIVRGEFRDAVISDVGASVSALEIADQADTINHLEEVLGRIANVNFASGASRSRFVQIRGIGERGQFAEPLNSSVGLLIDGVDMSGIGTAALMHDVAQVEVFRGPQGTIYGANALAGLINVVTEDPGPEWEGELSMDAANYGSRSFGAMVAGPLSDRLGLRLSLLDHADDGFIDNDHLGRDDTNNRDESSFRAKLMYGGDAATWRLTLARLDADNGYDAFSLDNNRTTLSDQPGRDAQETQYGSFVMEAELTETLGLHAALGVVSSDSSYGYDEDWTFEGFHPWEYSSTDAYGRARDTQTLDVRLVSDRSDGFDWVAGVYALHQDVSLQRSYTFQAQDYFSDFEIDRVAVYGEVLFDLSPRSRLKIGLRGENHEARFEDSEGVRFDPDDQMVGGRIVYEHDVLDDAMVYVALNRGYKAGGFNTDGTLDADLRQFDPEVLWNLETGLKGRFADGRLNLSAILFYMQRDDVQVNTSITRVRPDNSAEFIDYTGNAAEGFNRGLELELDFHVNEVLSLFGSVGLLDTEYEDFVNGAGEVLDGREQAQAPGYQFYVGAELRLAPRWTARVEVEGRDAYYFSDTHDTRSDSYELLHASLGYSTERLDLTLWGRNITDEDYFVRGFFFGNDPRDGYTARPFTQLGEPARFGLSAALRF